MNAFNAGNKQSPTFKVKNDNGSTAFRTVYAIKRIPRERSVYDSPIIYDVFNEVTSLELLTGNKGVSSALILFFYCLFPALNAFMRELRLPLLLLLL